MVPNELIDKLRTSPCFLFLGQDYLKYGNEYDPFLFSINKRFSVEYSDNELTYDLLLELKNKYDIESEIAWIQNRSNKISKPEWLKKISNIPWNGVFTSAVDTVIIRSFKNNWREVQPVFNPDFYPKDFRSRSKMHLSYIFGSVSQEDINERPPFDIFEFETSKQKALKLLNRIDKELITPFGVLVIDGYNPNTDWIKPNELYPIINSLNKEQTYFFGLNKELLADPFINKLINDRKIIASELSLFETLLNNNLDLDIDDYTLVDNLSQKRITINHKVKLMPKELYNNISKNGVILDDQILLPKEDLSEEKDQELFRNFLYDSSTAPVWEAYKYQFNVPRHYEEELSSLITKALNTDYYSVPIILHAQTGTGKTVSLGSVAYKFKIMRKYPIIFIPRNTQSLSFNVLDDFCKWNEDNGADKTIIYWDDTAYNNGIEEYFELNNYLISKGRKVVIIGSAYKLNKETMKTHKASYVEAPIELTESEKIRFHEIFNKYSGHAEDLHRIWNGKYDNNFLVALYRLLPGSKYSIRKGVISEVEIHEMTLGKLLKISERPMTSMEQAFLNSGVDKSLLPIDNEEINFDFQKISEIISVIGQFGLGIPIELLLRTIKGRFDLELAVIISKLDFFKVIPNFNGVIQIYPRHRLEAKIVVDSKISIEKQIELIVGVISNIKTGDFANQDELDFIIELLKAVGPNNDEQYFKFREYYRKISETLEFLRTEKNIYNQRTILQEATYLREFIKYDTETSPKEKISLLKKCETTIVEEISKLNITRARNKSLGTLLIELSSNIGSQLRFMIDEKEYKTNILKKFDVLQEYLKKAQIYSSDPYYPLDIWAWTTSYILQYHLSFEEKSDICAKLFAIFDKVEMENPDIIFREDYNERLIMLGDLSGNLEISEEAFIKLIEMGSSAGIYLRAKKLLNAIDLKKPLTSIEEKQICYKAIEYLEKFQDLVYSDDKCLYLLLKLNWAYYNERPLFYNEKQTLNFSKDVWEHFKLILNRIIYLNNGTTSAQIKYLNALTLFHLGEIEECMSKFAEIRDNYYIGPRRIIISYLASNFDGTPKTYTGQLIGLDSNKALFYVPELRKKIPYFNRNFISNEPTLQTTYTGLNLGFNFLGIQVASI